MKSCNISTYVSYYNIDVPSYNTTCVRIVSVYVRCTVVMSNAVIYTIIYSKYTYRNVTGREQVVLYFLPDINYYYSNFPCNVRVLRARCTCYFFRQLTFFVTQYILYTYTRGETSIDRIMLTVNVAVVSKITQISNIL